MVAPLIAVIVALGLLPEAGARRHQPRGRPHDAPASSTDPTPTVPGVPGAAGRRRDHEVSALALLPSAATFTSPSLDYGLASPMLIVFGGGAAWACSPRPSCRRRLRYATQVAVTRRGPGRRARGRGVLAHATGTGSPPASARAPARSSSTARRCSCRGRSSCSRSSACSRRRADSSTPADRSPRRRPPSPAPPHEARARRAGVAQSEVFPLLLFSVGGMLLFPAANDLLTMFVALEVLSLPLYLLCGLARRRRLLSQEAALKYFLLGSFSSAFFLYGIGAALRLRRHRCDCPTSPTRSPSGSAGDGRTAAAARHRAARGRPAVQGRRGAVPRVDPRTSTRARRPR